MCEVALLNKSIVRLSKQSFARRIDSLSSTVEREKIAISRLNNSLAKLNDLLFDSYPTITEADYANFSPYLNILIKALHDLIKSYKGTSRSRVLALFIDKLNNNYKSLIEIDSDIRNFKILSRKSDVVDGQIAELESMMALGEGWDDADAYPIEIEAHDNALNLINSLSPSYLKKWQLFPDTNGTILMTRSDGEPVSISIGNDGFSYVALSNNKVTKSGNVEPFDINKLLTTVRQLSI